MKCMFRQSGKVGHWQIETCTAPEKHVCEIQTCDLLESNAGAFIDETDCNEDLNGGCV